jgi:hypothetical protein
MTVDTKSNAFLKLPDPIIAVSTEQSPTVFVKRSHRELFASFAKTFEEIGKHITFGFQIKQKMFGSVEQGFVKLSVRDFIDRVKQYDPDIPLKKIDWHYVDYLSALEQILRYDNWEPNYSRFWKQVTVDGIQLDHRLLEKNGSAGDLAKTVLKARMDKVFAEIAALGNATQKAASSITGNLTEIEFAAIEGSYLSWVAAALAHYNREINTPFTQYLTGALRTNYHPQLEF